MIVEVDFEVLRGACSNHPLEVDVWSVNYERCTDYSIGEHYGYCTPPNLPPAGGGGRTG